MVSLLFILFTLIQSPASDPTLADVRAMYLKANDHEKTCLDMIDLLEPYGSKKNALLYGYRAGAMMVMAKHVKNPFTKLSWFNKGKKMLEEAIKAAPEDVELRCLRFGVQANAPSFLNYNAQLQSDKSFILRRYSSVSDPVLKKNIVWYMSKWGNLNEREKALLK